MLKILTHSRRKQGRFEILNFFEIRNMYKKLRLKILVEIENLVRHEELQIKI